MSRVRVYCELVSQLLKRALGKHFLTAFVGEVGFPEFAAVDEAIIIICGDEHVKILWDPSDATPTSVLEAGSNRVNLLAALSLVFYARIADERFSILAGAQTQLTEAATIACSIVRPTCKLREAE